jgi:hypothetical protein
MCKLPALTALPLAALSLAACDPYSLGYNTAALLTATLITSAVDAGVDSVRSTPAKPAPVKIVCSDAGSVPVTDPTQRLETANLSFLPPTGPDWCIQRSAARQVSLMKHAMSGVQLTSTPSPEKMAHTFVAMAIPADMGGTTLATADELRPFLEGWLRAGGGVKIQGERAVLDTAPVPRFTHIDSQVAVDRSRQEECVAYTSVNEERANPRMPGAVLELRDSGIACLDPTVKGRVAILAFSERMVKGRPATSGISETVRREAEPFLRSLVLMAATPDKVGKPAVAEDSRHKTVEAIWATRIESIRKIYCSGEQGEEAPECVSKVASAESQRDAELKALEGDDAVALQN